MAYGYLKLTADTGAPVLGGSTDAGRMGWIEVLEFSFAARQQDVPGSRGRPTTAARWGMSLMKAIDTTSPLLDGYRAFGRNFRSGLLEILPSNPQAFHGSHDRPMPVPEVVYLFEDVGILLIQPSGGHGGAVEGLTLDAARMGWSYRTAVPPATTYAPGEARPQRPR